MRPREDLPRQTVTWCTWNALGHAYSHTIYFPSIAMDMSQMDVLMALYASMDMDMQEID